VGEAAAAAAKLAGKDVPPAGQALAAAEKSSAEAAKQAGEGNSEQAAAEQEKTSKSLKAAKQQLTAAMKQLAAERSKQLDQQARDAERLAAQAATVDPAALSALRDAQDRSQRAAGDISEKKENSPQISNDQAQANKDVARAAANLNAASSASSATRRSPKRSGRWRKISSRPPKRLPPRARSCWPRSATTMIIRPTAIPTEPNRASVRKIRRPTVFPLPRAPKGGKRRKAAEQLSKAQRDFAQAQRGTGEAAEELSDQSQIANRPLREAMELASNLPAENLPNATGAFSKGSQKLNPSAAGSEKGPASQREKGPAPRAHRPISKPVVEE